MNLPAPVVTASDAHLREETVLSEQVYSGRFLDVYVRPSGFY